MVAKDILASARKYKLYAEVIFGNEGDTHTTKFVVYDPAGETIFSSNDIDSARQRYNRLVKDL